MHAYLFRSIPWFIGRDQKVQSSKSKASQVLRNVNTTLVRKCMTFLISYLKKGIHFSSSRVEVESDSETSSVLRLGRLAYRDDMFKVLVLLVRSSSILWLWLVRKTEIFVYVMGRAKRF